MGEKHLDNVRRAMENMQLAEKHYNRINLPYRERSASLEVEALVESLDKDEMTLPQLVDSKKIDVSGENVFREKPTTTAIVSHLTSYSELINKLNLDYRRPNATVIDINNGFLIDGSQVVKLNTINLKAFVIEVEVKEEDGSVTKEKTLDFRRLMTATALATRASVRATLHPTNKRDERDRLIGITISGFLDVTEAINYNEEQKKGLLSAMRDIVNEEAHIYAIALRIPAPMLMTTINTQEVLTMPYEDVKGQFELYATFQRFFTDHNTSVTIYYKEEEREQVAQLVDEFWDDITYLRFEVIE